GARWQFVVGGLPRGDLRAEVDAVDVDRKVTIAQAHHQVAGGKRFKRPGRLAVRQQQVGHRVGRADIDERRGNNAHGSDSCVEPYWAAGGLSPLLPSTAAPAPPKSRKTDQIWITAAGAFRFQVAKPVSSS